MKPECVENGIVHLHVPDTLFQIKLIDPTKKMCTTFLGTGKPGASSEQETHFNEPGGVCVSPDGQQLFVADTNNHVIRVVELESKKVMQVNKKCCRQL